MTNEDVLNAVNRLTTTYNELSDKFQLLQNVNNFVMPLYKNHRIDWFSDKEFKIEDAMTHLINIGAGAIERYGKWHHMDMIKIANKTVITNATNQVPENFIIVKVKPVSDNTNQTFFIHYAHADNFSHGLITCWISDPTTKIPVRLLGTSISDHNAGTWGKSVSLGPDNDNSDTKHRWRWFSYNFNKEDLSLVDEDGYLYFALSSSVPIWYLSGWAIAERNTDFFWTPGKIFNSDLYGSEAKAELDSNNYNYLYLYRFFGTGDQNREYLKIRIPYSGYNKDLLLGALILRDHEIGKVLIRPSSKVSEYKSFDCIPSGNFTKIKSYFKDYMWKYIHFTKSEVASSTISVKGLNLFEFDLKVLHSDRHYLFNGMFTENE